MTLQPSLTLHCAAQHCAQSRRLIPPWTDHPVARQDGTFSLNPEVATALAALVADVRGHGKPGTTPAECRRVRAEFFADLYEVCTLTLT